MRALTTAKQWFYCLLMSIFLSISASAIAEVKEQQRPNVLWIVSEDNSPFIGAYGDKSATTPNLDQLAKQGFLYTHAYANAPVCAPARNTIITGVYANASGTQHMRSKNPTSDVITLFPKILKNNGYYVSNNYKEDYNTTKMDDVWHESSRDAHYNNRDKNQPFFHIYNIGISHESSIHKLKPLDELKHDPSKMTLPPYHPDTPEVRRDWAQYYDAMTRMDNRVGEILQELEDNGLADNTIVFYYGDHGGVLGRSKRFVYESGTQVPLIIHVPEKYNALKPSIDKHIIDRLVSFVDLAPTMLSLAEVPIPSFMQGHAFLGPQKAPAAEYAYMFRGRMDERYDMSRAVRSQQFRYIRNYMPYRIYGQKIGYLWRAASVQSWEKECKAGNCNAIQQIFWQEKPIEELYDTENDPWEVNNLAQNPAYKKELTKLRQANIAWAKSIKDVGFIHEAELKDRIGTSTAYDYARTSKLPINAIIDSANDAIETTDWKLLVSFLQHSDSAIRYWGATGLRKLGSKASPAINALRKSVNDASLSVAVVAAETLYLLGEKKTALPAFIRGLASENKFTRVQTMNAIDVLDIRDQRIIDGVITVFKNGAQGGLAYDKRAAELLLLHWQLKPEDYIANI